MTRQPALGPDDLDERQLALYSSITEGPRSKGPQAFDLTGARGELLGPFGGFLLSPELGNALQALGTAIRYRTGLSARVREMAILLVAAHWDSSFERHAHEATGRSVGLSEAEILSLRTGKLPELSEPTEIAAATLVQAMLAGDIDDPTWDSAGAAISPAAVFELTTLVGYYGTLALQMRTFRV